MRSGQATRGSFAMAVREYQTTFELLPDVVNVLNEIRDADSGSRVHQAVCGPSFLDIVVILVLQMEALERHIAACQALIDRLPVLCSDPAEQMQSLAMLRDVLESKRSAPLSLVLWQHACWLDGVSVVSGVSTITCDATLAQ